MGEKRFARRRTVFGLAVLSLIVLVVAFTVFEKENLYLQNQVKSENKTIASLNEKNNSLAAENTALQDQLTQHSSATIIHSQSNSSTSTSSSTASSSPTPTASSDQNKTAQYKATIEADETKISNLNAKVDDLSDEVSWLHQNSISNGAFSIVQITDTQYLSDSYPWLFYDLTNWIASNRLILKPELVIHTGDIVQNPDNFTDWQNANFAMMNLYNNAIPYCWDAGNHDQLTPSSSNTQNGNPNTSWIGKNYPAFNVAFMRQQPFWVGDIFDGKSTATQFAVGNYHFMVINIEYNANQTVLDWMQTLIKTHPTTNIIVATHNFLNGVGTLGTKNAGDTVWASNFDELLDNYPNVFMTLNGHDADTSPAFHYSIGNREEIFFNRQEADNHQGAACARIYTFNFNSPDGAVIDVNTYKTYGVYQYLSDSIDQFSFQIALDPYLPVASNVVNNTDFVGASGYGISFAAPVTLNDFSQYGDSLTFNNLTLNGVTSNFTASVVGANIVVSSFDSHAIRYTVDGSVGTQTFSADSAPTSVIIEAARAGDGWTYQNGEVTVTGATASVTVNFD